MQEAGKSESVDKYLVFQNDQVRPQNDLLYDGNTLGEIRPDKKHTQPNKGR